MQRFRIVENPNLPEGKVRLIFVGKAYSNRLDLDKHDIDTIDLEPCTLIEKPISSHVDMQSVHLYSNNFIFHQESLCKAKRLYDSKIEHLSVKNDLKLHFINGSRTILLDYPQSASYNVLIIDQFAIYNPKCIDPILEQELQKHYKCLFVKQGYARCSTCIVDQNSIITADTSIASVLQQAGFNVLMITPGHIELPGYDYGFIGGAAFKIDKMKLAFTGKLDRHPDKNKIIKFLDERGVEPVFLSSEPIFDIGSGIPVIEEV